MPRWTEKPSCKRGLFLFAALPPRFRSIASSCLAAIALRSGKKLRLRLPRRHEQPEPLKFASPIVLLPELFTGQHLAVMLGYLATIGWEVYAPDLRAAAGRDAVPPLGRLQFDDLLGLAGEALDAIGRPAIVMGHGLGGLLALKLVEMKELKAAVALAPQVPGLRNRLLSGWPSLAALWLGRPLNPPTGRTMFEFLLDVEPFSARRW